MEKMDQTTNYSDTEGDSRTEMASPEHSILLPADDNGNDVSKIFIPPEPTQNPYESHKMVEVVTKDIPLEATTISMIKKKGGLSCACQNYMGIILTLTSGFIFTCGGVIVKYMKDFHPVTLAVYRFQGVFLPAIILALYGEYVKKETVFGTVWPLTDKVKLKQFIFTSVRGILGGVALILLFYSIQTLSFADAIVINSSRPVFVTFAAHVFLREPCGVFTVAAALLSIVGVGVIARPPMLTGEASWDTDTLIGVGISFTGMLIAASSMVVLRYLRGVHVSLVALGFGFWGTVISAIAAGVIGRFDLPQTGEDYVLAVCLAVCTFVAQVMITAAMHHEQAAAVAVTRSSDAIFAFFLQFVVLGVVPDWYSLLGALLILFCVIMVAIRKWISTLPEKHPSRKRLWFVLK